MAGIDEFPVIPPGKVALVVTSLEMLAPPTSRPAPATPFPIRRIRRPDAEWYRHLFRRVGADWLWFGRLRLTDTELTAIIQDPSVEVFALSTPAGDGGLLELDFRVSGECEIAYFGVAPELIGRGAGRALMSAALTTAWSRPIRRLWVHTCTADHQGALAFYVRSGFTPYRRQVEVADDPRLLGLLPEAVAPHVPIIRS